MFGLGSLITGILSIGKSLLSLALPSLIMKGIGTAIMGFAKALGVGVDKDEDDIEEIGDRALQAEEKGIKPEKFESAEDWLNEIEKDDWGFDPKKNKDLDPREKISKGIEVSAALCAEKLPNDLRLDLFFNAVFKNNEMFSPEMMSELGKLANTNIDDFRKVVDYMIGKADNFAEIKDARDLLISIEKIINPSLSAEDAWSRASAMFNLEK
jgi:hypothetical protein